MARGQGHGEIVQRLAARAQQHEEVKQQVGGLAEQFAVVRRGGSERRFDAFFADLLRDAPDPGVEQLRRIAAGRALECTPGDQRVELGQERERRRAVVAEARSRAEMARRPDRLGMDDERIACLLYTSPSPRDRQKSRMPSSA